MNQTPTDTIIITGGSGLIGTALIDRFALTYRIAVLDVKEPQSPLPAGCEFHRLDLTSEKEINETIQRVAQRADGRIASVIHLAAYYDFSGEPSPLYEDVTVRGTQRLLRALRNLAERHIAPGLPGEHVRDGERGASSGRTSRDKPGAMCEVGQFIFSSTMLIHAPAEPGVPITEDSPIDPKWEYPRSKVEAERFIREERGGIPAVHLRIAGVYTDRCDSIPIANQIQRIQGRMLTARVFPGDVTHGQAWVHLDDLVDAVERAVQRRRTLPDETAILIGEPQTPSYDEIQRTLARLIHGDDDWTTMQIPKSVAKTGAWVQDKIPGMEEPFIKPWMIDLADDHYDLDIRRARELLGWEPRRRLLDTLPIMVEHLEADPIGFYRHNKITPPRKVRAEAASR